MTLRTEVLGNSDRGLLGIAADPQFDLNGWIYLLLVVDPNGDGNDDDAPEPDVIPNRSA